MRSDRSVPRRVPRSPSVRLARAGSAVALALMVATCHSDKVTNVCTVSQLVFTTQPTSVGAGALMTVVVAAQNAGSTQTCFTGDITLALAGGSAGAVLNGNAPVSAVSGVATFSGLNITKAGSGFTLVASGGGVSGVASSSFSISPGPAVALAFTTQPPTSIAGAAFTTAVTARDQYGNTATTFTGGTNSVTVAIGTNGGTPTPGALSGVKVQVATNGVATFPGLNIDKVGTNYTLSAAATNLTGTTSAAFNINPGAAAALFFTAQPSNVTAGVAMAPVVVTARDAQGNTATGLTGNVTLAITGGTGTAGATLSGGTAAVSGGVATFPGLKIDKSGTGYTLTATAAGVGTGATSTAFDVNPGTATHLAFTVQPAGDTAGGIFSPAIVVTALDAGGNTDTAFHAAVAVAIGTNPSSGTLGGTASTAAVAGIATFTTLTIDKSGTGYTLTASATGLTPDTSVPFTITAGTATQLVFTQQPTTAQAMVAINPAVVVTARDAHDNTATGLTGNVTLAITGGTGSPGASLFGGTVAVAAGVASFPALKLDKSGANYTLTASATGVPTATSATFNITPAAATRLAFTVQPPNDTAGGIFAPAITVTALDSVGNTDTSFKSTVTMDFAVNAGTGSLKGTLNRTAVAGVATFDDLSINKSGTGYQLHATDRKSVV